jgi:hypothetical protein
VIQFVSKKELREMSQFAKHSKMSNSLLDSSYGNLRIPSTLEICPLPLSDDEEGMMDEEDAIQTPIDLSYSKVSAQKRRRQSSFFDKPREEDSSQLPQEVWHICELCDDNSFPSRKVLSDHMWQIHKTQRVPFQTKRRSVTAANNNHVEIVLTKRRESRNTNFPITERRCLADEIIYHPPANRRRASNSSSSGSGSSASSYTQPFNELDSEGSSPEMCRVCFIQIDDKRKLADHIKTFHPSDNRFLCTMCDRVLSSRAALQGILLNEHCKLITKFNYRSSQDPLRRETQHLPDL